ncbi:MAG: DpnI domain-containing protein [Candidatus Fimenecus sp.]
MNLTFDIQSTEKYHSASQITRVLTETWVHENMYCPRCGNLTINRFENNRPVADFFCPACRNEYELKSKSGSLSKKVNDGAYETMIKRITSNQNPDFFFMNYSKTEHKVKDFIIVPKHFFTPSIIEKRKPLAPTARRAGWVGCNILVGKIPTQGKIPIISNGNVLDKNNIIKQVNRSRKLETSSLESRGWLMDVLNCVNTVEDNEFSLSQIYIFENELQEKHPNNNNVKPKIRQQLQFLRDKGFIEFLGNGKYKKIL